MQVGNLVNLSIYLAGFLICMGDCMAKTAQKKVYRALLLTRDYNTKSQKSKKLPGKSKIYKVPHEHDA
jgi:hypothetical protein